MRSKTSVPWQDPRGKGQSTIQRIEVDDPTVPLFLHFGVDRYEKFYLPTS